MRVLLRKEGRAPEKMINGRSMKRNSPTGTTQRSDLRSLIDEQRKKPHRFRSPRFCRSRCGSNGWRHERHVSEQNTHPEDKT